MENHRYTSLVCLLQKLDFTVVKLDTEVSKCWRYRSSRIWCFVASASKALNSFEMSRISWWHSIISQKTWPVNTFLTFPLQFYHAWDKISTLKALHFSDHHETLIQQHVTFQKTCILDNTAVETQNLAFWTVSLALLHTVP